MFSGLLAKLGGGALILAAFGLIVWLYGKSQFNAGQLSQNVKWEKVVSKAQDDRLAVYAKGVASVAAAENTYHETVRDRIVPVTQTVIERAATYATTTDGKQLCLPAERVSGLRETRSALFGTDAGAPSGDSVGTVPPATSPRR